jgi:hypothetical protein
MVAGTEDVPGGARWPVDVSMFPYRHPLGNVQMADRSTCTRKSRACQD